MSWIFWVMAIPVLGISILIHEIGHFLAARWMKVKIEEFGIGFPPRMLKLGERNGVDYTLNWIPFGGFVRLAGEDDPSVEGGLAAAAPWRRVVVLTAGAFMNLVLAFAIFVGLAMYGQPEIVSDQVGIYYVEPDTPAQRAGLQRGDILVSINDKPVTSFEDIRIETTLNRGHTITLTLERDGRQVTTSLVPRREVPEGQGPIGIRLVYYESPVTVQWLLEDAPAEQAGLQEGDTLVAIDGQPIEDSLAYMDFMDDHMGEEIAVTVRRDGERLPPIALYNDPEYENLPLGIDYLHTVQKTRSFVEGLVEGWRQTVDAAVLVPRTLAGLFRRSIPVSDLSGPVGIVYMGAQVAQVAGLYGLLQLTALIGVNLCLVNLFPLPALDGGRLAFVLVEWVRGKRLSPEKEGFVHMVGFLLLLAFLVVITYFDLVRIFTGNGTGP